MSRLASSAVLALLIASGVDGEGQAAFDHETMPTQATGIELLVVEAQGCIYCPVFRRDVLPRYEATERVRHVPMHFADIDEIETKSLAVAQPIATVPTVLVLKDRREVGRITGYLGPEDFLRVISGLLSGLE